MSKSILNIDFVVEEQGRINVVTIANKSLSKQECYLLVEDYLSKLERMIKDEAN